jgi:hypothetical protein
VAIDGFWVDNRIWYSYNSWLHLTHCHTQARSPKSHLNCVYLVVAPNGRCSSSGFPNCARSQLLPFFFNNSSQQLNPKQLSDPSSVGARVTLRLVVYRQSVSLSAKPLEAHNQRFLFQLNPCGQGPDEKMSLSLMNRYSLFQVYKSYT